MKPHSQPLARSWTIAGQRQPSGGTEVVPSRMLSQFKGSIQLDPAIFVCFLVDARKGD